MRSEAAAPEAAEAAGRPAAGPLRRLREAYARADLADAHVALVEPSLFYRALNKAPAAAHALLVFVAGQSCAFVRAMVEAGADAVAIADPSATGEIMGPRHFQEFAMPYINEVAQAVREAGRARGGSPTDVIVHICGRIRPIYRALAGVEADALSFDSCVSLREARAALPGKAIMGNVSTYAIEFASPDKVRSLTRASLEAGADIVAPACGLGMRSPLANVRAMLEETRASGAPRPAREA